MNDFAHPPPLKYFAISTRRGRSLMSANTLLRIELDPKALAHLDFAQFAARFECNHILARRENHSSECHHAFLTDRLANNCKRLLADIAVRHNLVRLFRYSSSISFFGTNSSISIVRLLSMAMAPRALRAQSRRIRLRRSVRGCGLQGNKRRVDQTITAIRKGAKNLLM